MAENTITVTVSAEASIHEALRKFAQQCQDDYGVMISRVDFTWAGILGAPPALCSLEVTTTSGQG